MTTTNDEFARRLRQKADAQAENAWLHEIERRSEVLVDRHRRGWSSGTCEDCGTVCRLSWKSTRCPDCQRKADRDQARVRQSQYRCRRRMAAGVTEAHVVTRGEFQVLTGTGMLKRIPCERCGIEFRPTRVGMRFCSTRCRVAAHRARKAAH
jgi:hypothetical protein